MVVLHGYREVTIINQITWGSLRWSERGVSFQVKGKVAVATGINVFGRNCHILLHHGRPVKQDGSLGSLGRSGVLQLPEGRWVVKTTKFKSDNAKGRGIRVDFCHRINETGLDWVQLSIPIDKSGDPGRAMARTFEQLKDASSRTA